MKLPSTRAFAAFVVAAACFGIWSDACRSQTPSHTQLILKPGDTVVVIAAKDTTTPPPPSGHEPSGMTPQINTGHITSANTTFGTSGAYGTMRIAGPITATWTIFSPTTTTPTGENRANLQLDPAGGLMVVYPTNVVGGNSPVRFGTGIPHQGTGVLYSREVVHTVAYQMSNTANGPKWWEPRTAYQGGTTGENHVIGSRAFPGPSDVLMMPYFFLQGPNGQSRNLSPNSGTTPYINVADGGRHVVEMLEIMEAVPGQPTGEQDVWVDDVLEAHYTNVQYLATGQTGGWVYWMSDPTYGGAPASQHPPHQWSITHDSIYVSTK